MKPADADTILRDMGRRIAELRAGRAWTQAGFAEAAGVSLKYIQRIEAGSENLGIRSLIRLASLLGTNLVDLFAAPADRASRRGRPPKRRPVR